MEKTWVDSGEEWLETNMRKVFKYKPSKKPRYMMFWSHDEGRLVTLSTNMPAEEWEAVPEDVKAKVRILAGKGESA